MASHARALFIAALVLAPASLLLAPKGDTAVPAMPYTPPQAMALGVWASAGATVVYGSNPVAQAASQGGRTDEEAKALRVLVRSTDGANELATVDGLRVVSVANAQRWGAGPEHSSMQARAFANIAHVVLLNGLVEARLLAPHVFSSNGARLDSGMSRIAELYVAGTRVNVDGTSTIPLAGVGTLYVNETVRDPARGYVAVHSLRLHLTGDIDVIVGSAEAQSAAGEASAPGCRTWTEAYPVGTNSVLLGNQANTRHWAVMGDPGASGRGHASVYAADVQDTAPTILKVRAVGALDDLASNGDAWGSARGEVTDLDLLSGLVKVQLVRAVATAWVVGGDAPAPGLSDSGTTLAHATISGTNVDVTPEPNKVNLTLTVGSAVIGFVRLNEQTRTLWAEGSQAQAALRINMVHVVLTTSYLGLQAGTEIVVGHAIMVAQCGMTGPLVVNYGDPIGIHRF